MHWRAAGSSVILLCIFTTVCLGQGRGSRRFGGPTVENAAADEQLPSASTSHRFRSSSAERRSSNLRTSQNIVERDVEDIPPSGFAKLSYPDVSRTRESRRESARDKTEGPPTVASKREFQSRSARPIESSGAKEYERLTSSTGVRGGRNGLVGRTRTSVDSTPTTPTAVTSYVRRPSLRSRVEPQKEAKESDATESIRPRNGASPLRARGGVTQEAKTTESRGRTRESSTESLRPRNGGRTVEAATAAAPTPSSRTGRQRTYQEVPGRSQFRSRGNQEPTEQPSQPSRGSSSRGTNRFPTRISNVDSSAVQSEIPTRSSNFRSKAKLASRNEVLARNTVNPTKNEEAVKTEATTSLPPSIQTVTGGNVASPVPTEPAALSSPDETSPEQQIIDNPKPDNVNVEPLTPAPELNEAKPRYEATPPSIVSRGPGGSRRRGTARGPKLEEKKSSKTEDTVSEDDNYPEVYKQLKKSGSGPKEILALLKAKKQLRESQQLSKNRPFPVTPTPLVSSRRPEVVESSSPRPAPKYSGGRNYRKSLATERVVPSSTEETPKPLEAKPERSIGRGRSNYRNLQSGTVEVGERSRPGGETRFTSAKYQSLGLGRNNRESSRRFPSRSRNQPEDNGENEVLVTPSREVSEAPTVAKDENESNELVKSRPSLEDRLQLTAPDVKKSSKYVPRNREKESEKFRARTTESVDLTASESTPIRPRYELYNRHRETGSYKRTNFVTPLATEEAPTSEKSSVADRFKSRPSFKPQRKYTGKSYTYSSRYNSRQQEHELLLTENTSTQNNNFDEYHERNTRRFNGLTVDSLVSESEQIPISTEPNSPGNKKPRYKESYIQRVPPKGKKGRATTNKPFIFPTTDLWEALSQTKDASSTESTIAALLRSTTQEAQSTEDDFLKGDLGFQSSTVPMTTTTTTTPSTTSTTSTTTTTERIVNITTKKPVQPSVSTTATTRKPSTTPKSTTTKPRTTQTTPRKTTTTKSKKTAATTTTRKLATTTTTTQKPTTTSKPTTTTTTTRKPTTTTTTTKMPTTTTKKPTTTTKKPTTTTTTTRKPSTTTTKKPTTSTTTTRKPTTSTTTTPSTTTTTPSTTTTSTLRPEAKPTKAKSTTRSINDITTPRSQPQTTQKPRDTKSNTTPKPKPQSTLSDIELLNSVINGENSVNVTPTLSSSEGEAELANKVIQLAIERATQKSKTAPTTSKPKGKPKRKPKSTTKMTTTSTTTTTTTSTTSTTTSTTQQSTPNTTLDSLTTVTPTPTMTIFKFSEENKTVATEDNGANNKTGKISLWVLPADDNSTLTSVNGIPDKGTNQEQALQALLEQPELANLSVNEQLLLADVLSSTAFPQTTQKKRKKKPKTTPTTTTTTQAPLFPVLNALFGRNRIGAGRGLFGAGQDPGTSTVRTAAFGDDFDEPEPPLVQETPESQQGLVGAAINVTRAVSQFMGYVIQGATQSFQNYLQSRTRALADALTYPGSS